MLSTSQRIIYSCNSMPGDLLCELESDISPKSEKNH